MELAATVASQFIEEVFQAHVCGHQHAVGPGAAVGVGGAWGVPAFAGEIDLVRGIDPQRQAVVAVGHHLDLAGQYRQLGVVVELAHSQARRLAAEQALAGQHVQRRLACTGGEQDFTFKQAHQALLAVEMHIHRAAGVELQLAAVGQLYCAALAHRAAIVSRQRRQDMLLAQAPGGGRTGTQNQQQFKRLTSAAGGGRVQRCVGQGRGHAAQALVDALDLLPRALVFAVGIQPLLPGRLLAWVERALLHFQQPVHGLFGDLAGDVHRAK